MEVLDRCGANSLLRIAIIILLQKINGMSFIVEEGENYYLVLVKLYIP